MSKELSAKQARKRCDPAAFDCNSTEELEPIGTIIGQDRALSALRFGLNITTPGFNIFVSGPTGTGRTTAIKSFLDSLAAQKETPSDWSYVYNFKDSYCPRVLKTPAGTGRYLQKDMKQTIQNARRNIAQAFVSKQYTDRRTEITEGFDKQKEAAFELLGQKAKKNGFLLQTTPVGLIFIPAPKGEPMTEEEYKELSVENKNKLQEKQEELNKELKDEVARLRVEENSIQKKLEDTDREVARYSMNSLFDELKKKYKQLPQVLDYLNQVEQDVIENFEQFRTDHKISDSDHMGVLQGFVREQAFQKYEVNVIVDNSELKGAPVILELNPTFNNLFGRIEKEAQFGALYTDFSMIKNGSLHRANGGYLVVRVEDLLTNFQSWDGLKRTIRDGKLVVEEIGDRLGFVATKTLQPEPIPLDVKVLVIGEPLFYYLLLRLDLEFKELFKIKADFDTRMDRSDASLKDYAAVICRLCKEENLKHLTSGALAKIIEQSSRLAGDQEKLSTLFADISDIIRESNFWADEADTSFIEANHVEKAIEQKVYRSNLIQQRINEMIDNGMIIIDTNGAKVGQVNGLAIISLGDFAFGKPNRITATVSVGREGLVDIERESKLGGPLHTKGVMILNGYIAEKYVREVPLSLSARLVFEQSYEEVDGDSASSTELYALLSRLASVPIKQGIAVTGSVNQKGEVQAIGGLNEKIEGFFEVCRLKGLDGKQGVLIPASNVRNLMLREDIVEAVKKRKFHIYPVDSIDNGIEILTGMKAGRRLEDGSFEPDSINFGVQQHLTILAERLRDFTKGAEKADNCNNKS
ncbi:AAA family ATPase [Chloroflexota bacterium]